MKTLITLALLSASLGAQAATRPDLTCVDRSGVTYELSKKFGEIKSFHRSGLRLDILDSMTAKEEYNYLYFIHEEGDVVAAFRISDDGLTATGQILKKPVNCRVN